MRFSILSALAGLSSAMQMDPLTLYLLNNKDGNSDISLMMLLQNAKFGSDFGINPMLLTTLLNNDDDDMNNNDLTKLILLSGMQSQYPGSDFSQMLPLMMMGNDNMSPLLFAAFSTRFSGQNGGPEQRALMTYFARQQHYKSHSCPANQNGVVKECRCKSKFADFEIFMPANDEGFFNLAQLFDDVECTTEDNEPCYCCYEAKGQMELMMEFMMQPVQNNHNQANAWVELFKYKQDNKCTEVQNDAGNTCYCRKGHLPMMSENPMFAYFFSSQECKDDFGQECQEATCQECKQVGKGLDAMLPFLLTSDVENGENLMNMNSLFPYLMQDTECDANGETCTCDDQMDQMISLMMMSQQQNSGTNQMLNMMLMNNDDTCQGQTTSGQVCSCQQDNKLPMLMMLSQNNAATNLASAPLARSFGDIKKLMFLQQSDNASKAVMNDLFNQGFRMSDPNFNKAFMLARNGIPIGLVKVILAKQAGQADPQAMTNMLVASGLASMESAPMMVEKLYTKQMTPDANSFFISQLLDQGKIDPFMGFLVLARNEGFTAEQIRNVFKAVNFGGSNLLEQWAHGFSYVPVDLPNLVYPGARLSFAHLESLGVDTCSIIEPEARQECGFKGITADQCESRPYCCFNPILSDNAKYENTPWCYYNLYGLG